jgi:hypothetical protein
MRILILCPANTRGNCGVLDYSLALSDCLRKHSIDSSVFAIDKHKDPNHKKLIDFIQYFKPDWTSLQFVSYAYAKRGLITPFSLPWQKIKGRVGTHILFHETWNGAHVGASLKQRIIGLLQRFGIQYVVFRMKPNIVHTTNPLYVAMLGYLGISSTMLPLFSNIPISTSDLNPYEPLLARLVSGSTSKNWLIAALFGSIHPSSNLLYAISWLHSVSSRDSKHLLVVSLGKAAGASSIFENLANSLSSTSDVFFHVVGKLDASDLSLWIKNADCCLCTTPHNIIQKSGSAKAFLEHGVPIIAMDHGSSVRCVSYKSLDLTPDIWLFGDPRLVSSHSLPPRKAPSSCIDEVALQFLADLGV